MFLLAASCARLASYSNLRAFLFGDTLGDLASLDSYVQGEPLDFPVSEKVSTMNMNEVSKHVKNQCNSNTNITILNSHTYGDTIKKMADIRVSLN